MNKREYAEYIANKVNGEVTEVNKTNGIVLTGIVVNIGDTNIRPCVYIDAMYDNGIDKDEAVRQTLLTAEQAKTSDFSEDLSWLTDYEAVKPKLRARLLNKSSVVEVSKTAMNYGFPDLIIVPIITIMESEGNMASAKVTKGMLDSWGVTKEKVIKDALNNIKQDIVIKEMWELLKEKFGYPDFMVEPMKELPMIVISNASGINGATAILFTKEILKEKFPEGYIVIPSSIHECIAIPMDDGNKDFLRELISGVNSTELTPEEVLSDRPYIFAA